MSESFGSRLQHAWSVFRGRDRPDEMYVHANESAASSYRPDRARFSRGNERSIVSAIYNRIAIDVASNEVHHVRVDKEGRFVEYIRSGLDDALNISANIDQTGRELIQDAVQSLFDEGCIAIVAVDTTEDPTMTNSYDVLSLRIGKITRWFPDRVRVEVYNEKTGRRQEVVLPKTMVAIVENPLYSVMNEPNSTLKRLIRKLNILDAIDEQSGSGKLDIIIQLPYIIKSEARKKQAEERRQMIEDQLSGSKYGVAYTDGTEKITQLNRAAENNLMKQIEYLTNMLFSQLGSIEDVFNGTADEKTMLNYYNRTVEPVLAAIVNAIKRTFLTKTARTQGQSIMWHNDPFKLVPVAALAEIADKFTRNEILSPNEIRAMIGRKPANDPAADELRNRNINQANAQKDSAEGEQENEDLPNQ